MNRNLPWFRVYTEMVDDEKLRLLAFEDRWHFVALLCLKGSGILDEGGDLLFRKVAVKLGVQARELDEIARRLAEVGLIDAATLQPVSWDLRQFKSDDSSARVRAYRKRKRAKKDQANQQDAGVKRSGNVTVTAQDTDTDTDKENKQKKKQSFADRPDDVNADAWNDWLLTRKEKRAGRPTMAVMRRLETQAEKAGLSVGQAIEYAAANSWVGFNATWYENREGQAPAVNNGVGVAFT